VGLFSKLFGMADGKVNLIRALLRQRIAIDPTAKRLGQTPAFADEMPTMMLMGLPEATIVTCVESWAQMRGQRVPDAEIARRIASFRGGAPGATTVEDVIRYRVQAEHGQSGFLPAEHVEWCIREARTAYGIA
jgi:hypothetical protein